MDILLKYILAIWYYCLFSCCLQQILFTENGPLNCGRLSKILFTKVTKNKQTSLLFSSWFIASIIGSLMSKIRGHKSQNVCHHINCAKYSHCNCIFIVTHFNTNKKCWCVVNSKFYMRPNNFYGVNVRHFIKEFPIW